MGKRAFNRSHPLMIPALQFFYPRGRSQGVVVVLEAGEGGSRTPPDVGVPADSPQGEEEDEG